MIYNKTIIWWLALSIISILNIIFICTYIASLKNINKTQIYLFTFSFIYTIVCAIRAIWPRKDVEQICLFDFKISSIMIGRSLATIAEISYILLILLVFNIITKNISIITKKKKRYLLILINIVLLLIIIAQIFCWLGLITKYYIWNALEESLWTVSALILIVVSCILYKSLNLRKTKKTKKINSLLAFLKVFIIISIIYVIFMCVVDIPMYYNRWKKSYNRNISLNDFVNDFKKYNKRLTLNNFYNLHKCKTINRDIDVWKYEIPWLTGYFTFGVWTTYAIIIWYNGYIKL